MYIGILMVNPQTKSNQNAAVKITLSKYSANIVRAPIFGPILPLKDKPLISLYWKLQRRL